MVKIKTILIVTTQAIRQKKCVNAQVRFIKTVRLRPTLIELEKLLQDNMNLKIVLSMRDPRGIMNSRQSFPRISANGPFL